MAATLPAVALGVDGQDAAAALVELLDDELEESELLDDDESELLDDELAELDAPEELRASFA